MITAWNDLPLRHAVVRIFSLDHSSYFFFFFFRIYQTETLLNKLYNTFISMKQVLNYKKVIGLMCGSKSGWKTILSLRPPPPGKNSESPHGSSFLKMNRTWTYYPPIRKWLFEKKHHETVVFVLFVCGKTKKKPNLWFANKNFGSMI